MDNFSYQYYLKLIKTIRKEIPLVDFSDISERNDRFFILRHDVEFSVEKAYALAKLEHEQLGIKSSYFFQLRNYSYNPLAFNNMALIRKIHEMGHKIGLHVNTSGLTELNTIGPFIKNDVELLKNGLGLPVDRFSFHRPSHELLSLNLVIDGLINAYDKQFFHFFHQESPEVLKVYYFSDSEHKWKYGYPLSILEKAVKKIQLLVHPYMWADENLDDIHMFKLLIQEKQQLMVESMNSECRHFPEELLPHEKI